MAVKRVLIFSSKGFTLIEALMTVAILGIVFVMVPTLLMQMTKLQRQSESRLEIQRDARIALDLVNRNLREAQAGTVVVNRLSGQPFYSRVEFTRQDGKQVIFYQKAKDFNMVVAGSTKTLSRNLLYLAFTYPQTSDTKIISVSLTTEKATYDQASKNLQLSVEKVRIMNE